METIAQVIVDVLFFWVMAGIVAYIARGMNAAERLADTNWAIKEVDKCRVLLELNLSERQSLKVYDKVSRMNTFVHRSQDIKKYL